MAEEKYTYHILYGRRDYELLKGTLEDAKQIADKSIRKFWYFEVSIQDADRNDICERQWHYSLKGIEDCKDPILMDGRPGYYDDWH